MIGTGAEAALLPRQGTHGARALDHAAYERVVERQHDLHARQAEGSGEWKGVDEAPAKRRETGLGGGGGW